MRKLMKIMLIILAFITAIILITVTAGIFRFVIFNAFKSSAKSIWEYNPEEKIEESTNADKYELDKR
ncbi:hypothetical protein ACM55G_01120 [Flavobacterium sp. LB3P122]|uniref:hypothetical protein n=1 Tax=Flavobacterium TaxID=237 RepID=UPI003A85B1F9